MLFLGEEKVVDETGSGELRRKEEEHLVSDSPLSSI